MKKDIISQAVADLSDRYVQEAAVHRRRRRIWPAAMAAVLALSILVGALVYPQLTARITPDSEKGFLTTAHAAGYEPDYEKPYSGEALSEGYLAAIRRFAAQAGQNLLDGGKSTAYSPTALYTALSMVAELADEPRQNALLDTLGADGMELLRQYSGDLWRYLCANPDTKAPGKITLANSLWLDSHRAYNADTLQTLADRYYVSSFTGDMQGDIPERISQWVRRHTNDLLDCQVEPDKDTLAILLSAIYFYDEWQEKVYSVEPGSFKSYGTVWTPCNYLERTQQDGAYYTGNGVTASVQYFTNGGKMLFILPDEDSDPTAVLKDSDLLTALLGWESLEKAQAKRINWQIPRFSVRDTLDLQSGMTALGLGELFDMALCPLTKLCDDDPCYIGKAEQGTSIAIDENGCEAASYVEMDLRCGAAMRDPNEEVDMILSRPFVFAILSDNDVPLFLGVVNTPDADAPVAEFDWEWEQESYNELLQEDGVVSTRDSGFVNTQPQPIHNVEEAIERAKADWQGNKYDSVSVYHDANAGMWCVSLCSEKTADNGSGIKEGLFLTGQIFLTDDGITKWVVAWLEDVLFVPFIYETDWDGVIHEIVNDYSGIIHTAFISV